MVSEVEKKKKKMEMGKQGKKKTNDLTHYCQIIHAKIYGSFGDL